MKTCFKCKQEKNRSEFYKHPQMGDGLLGKCKECTKKDSAENLARKWQDPQFRIKECARHREKSRRYREESRVVYNKKKTREYLDRHIERYPEKHAARLIVASAIKSGFIQRQPCVKCGLKAQAHHEDYSKPLDVIWYCPKHHAERHVEINDEKRLAGIK